MGTRRDLGPEEALADVVAANGTGLAQFHADWCAPWAVLDEFIDEVVDDLDALVVRIGVETHADLAERHEITSNPTLLIYEDGTLVERELGLPDREGFRDLVAPWTDG